MVMGRDLCIQWGFESNLRLGESEWLKKRHKGTINKSFTPVRVEWTTGSNYIYYGV